MHMDQLIDHVNFQNQHWQGTTYALPLFERDLLSLVWHDLDTKLIALITGTRRVGKSVMLKQLINKLIKEKNVPPRQILFYEFAPHQSQSDLWETFNYFSHTVCDPRLPTYLFFDEIQYLSEYESTIKDIYDNSTSTKIFLTGSLSLTYKHKMHEGLAGRFFAYSLYPLNFKEYLQLFHPQDAPIFDLAKQEKDSFKKRRSLSILNHHFRHFLEFGRFPELSTLNQTQSVQYLQNILNQSLNQDVYSYFDIQKPPVISALFEYLRLNNGGIVSGNKLTKLLGTSNQTISGYLGILEIMGLIYTVYNTTNPLIKLNSGKKIYVDSAFALLNTKYDQSTALGAAVESYILEQLRSRDKLVTFWRNRNKEIDLLLPKEHLGYEIKFRRDPQPLTLTLSHYKLELITLQDNNPACLY